MYTENIGLQDFLWNFDPNLELKGEIFTEIIRFMLRTNPLS